MVKLDGQLVVVLGTAGIGIERTGWLASLAVFSCAKGWYIYKGGKGFWIRQFYQNGSTGNAGWLVGRSVLGQGNFRWYSETDRNGKCWLV